MGRKLVRAAMIVRTTAAIFVVTASLAAANQDKFRSGVDAVAIDAAVLAGARPVSGLTAADFEITDNGVRQTIVEVVGETLPIDLTLVLDTSGSISTPLHESIVRAVKRVQDRLRPADRVRVITFNERLREELALTPATSIGTVAWRETTGQTAMNDAIALALVTAPPPPQRRQMALVFTDGVDTRSFLDEPQILNLALRAQTAVFVVAQEFPAALPLPFLNELTESTGGLLQVVPPTQTSQTRVLTVPAGAVADPVAGSTIPTTITVTESRVGTPGNLIGSSFVTAFDAFRASYVLRYTLTGVPRAGWHNLTVRVVKHGTNYAVRTRRGYFGSSTD